MNTDNLKAVERLHGRPNLNTTILLFQLAYLFFLVISRGEVVTKQQFREGEWARY